MAQKTEFQEEDWNIKRLKEHGVICTEITPRLIRQLTTVDRLQYYAFCIITQGRLTMLINGTKMTYRPGDLYTYTPGLAYIVEEVSEDYRALMVVAREGFTFEAPVVYDMVRAAYFPFIVLVEPRITLSPIDAENLGLQMRYMIRREHEEHPYKTDLMRMMFAVFLVDLKYIMGQAEGRIRKMTERTEELFLEFLRLLPRHFVEHHDIGFYAERLGVTTVYLSRVVKKMTGRTVMDYINQMLMMEASWRLISTNETTVEIAEHLHFSSQASFCRFYTRMKGVTPKEFRERRGGR